MKCTRCGYDLDSTPDYKKKFYMYTKTHENGIIEKCVTCRKCGNSEKKFVRPTKIEVNKVESSKPKVDNKASFI
jgi:DNA-directed RNA polymerase subunit M/transcription elongation factor TFIIS